MKAQFEKEQSESGEFQRQADAFRDPNSDSRGGASSHEPFASTDPINGFHFLAEAYHLTNPNFDGRVTVPALWDKVTKKIVNNCEDDICRMFNDAFRGLAQNNEIDLFPRDIAAEQEKLSGFIYDKINNGVYKAGFTTRQHVYE